MALNALGVLTMEISLVNKKVLAHKESFQKKALQILSGKK